MRLTSQGIVDNINSRNMALKRCIPPEMTAFPTTASTRPVSFSELARLPSLSSAQDSVSVLSSAPDDPHHTLGFIPLTEADYPHCATAQRAALCFMISPLSFACDRHQEVSVVNGHGK
ncbi:hypothetical protein QQF64_025265 [Cirrhinus molitorella]|uniref:Uncharacterized protein n=1 Tax=Cirrhinus molitorella TaxID=172907 RepID=A0ABR3NPB9_9TELE